jgi:hypothetical protein
MRFTTLCPCSLNKEWGNEREVDTNFFLKKEVVE